ncbi:NlpC/P60 family protein [Shigella sonnei]
MTRRGVDCSGFVGCDDARSFRFAAARETKQQALLARKLIKTSCCRGDLVFSKRVPEQMVCM